MTEPISVVIPIEKEDQYSVILLNCFPTPVTVSVWVTSYCNIRVV